MCYQLNKQHKHTKKAFKQISSKRKRVFRNENQLHLFPLLFDLVISIFFVCKVKTADELETFTIMASDETQVFIDLLNTTS